MKAGIDEVGRGSVAGPVVAAAVILPSNFFIEEIKDSKRIPPKKREAIANIIKKEAYYGVGIVSAEIIDLFGIAFATMLAMINALNALPKTPSIIFIDAFHLPLQKIVQIPMIKGDVISPCIGAASIIAKVQRDRIMRGYHMVYPQYGFAKNKGYLTKEHVSAIKKWGLSPLHRRSFLHKFL